MMMYQPMSMWTDGCMSESSHLLYRLQWPPAATSRSHYISEVLKEAAQFPCIGQRFAQQAALTCIAE